ncbi:MAG: hypothetical protein AAFX85_07020, partial [Pseudomonadota bacterium]
EAGMSNGVKAILGGVLLLAWLALAPALANRYGDGIFVPTDAEAIDSLRWRDITSITPLNRELIVLRTRERPYLLTLKRPCPTLRPDSIIVTEQEDRIFDPSSDLLRAAPPPNSGLGPRALNGQGKFNRNGLIEGTTRCRPDAMYAVTEEDLEWVQGMIDQSKASSRRKRR